MQAIEASRPARGLQVPQPQGRDRRGRLPALRRRRPAKVEPEIKLEEQYGKPSQAWLWWAIGTPCPWRSRPSSLEIPTGQGAKPPPSLRHARPRSPRSPCSACSAISSGNNGLSDPKKQELAVSIQSLDPDYLPPAPRPAHDLARSPSLDRPIVLNLTDERRVAGVDGTPQPAGRLVRLHRCSGVAVYRQPLPPEATILSSPAHAARPAWISALDRPSQSRTWSSALPNTIRVPSGLHLTDKTGDPWPSG